MGELQVGAQAGRSSCSSFSKTFSNKYFLLTMLFSTLMLLTTVTLSASQCIFRNGGKKFDVKEGEVTSVKGDKVRVCEGGKLIKKAKDEVPQPLIIGCGGLVPLVVRDQMFWWKDDSGGEVLGSSGGRQEISETKIMIGS